MITRILLAASALSIVLTNSAIAEVETNDNKNEDSRVFLVISWGCYGCKGADGMNVLPMKDMDSCEEQGSIFMSSKRIEPVGALSGITRGYECLEGVK